MNCLRGWSGFAVVAMIAFSSVNGLVAADAEKVFLGRWTAGRVSMIQYKNSVTGAPAPTSGNNFAYDIRPDGTYTYTGLMQNTMYHCTTAVFSNESGTWELEGDVLHMRPTKNPYKMTNSCAPSSNKEAAGKLINKNYRFKVSMDGKWRKLELTDVQDGAVLAFHTAETDR